ncbi:sigma-70 family RNA polymerase sigma factor [Nannocystis punicea]|uniref:Sigma-70 family RNA polymerase sigma factor n=1 Tax=Nannocystis punicea TaxID=2995304 RepID=A0ABY7GVM2_9BACT|nr:sigma-70 family RNA polymerase sigma factor [Nannocystis poenicansa]WAS91013.1 sigma-70 family RNA polymerase sigma factor [Nannocystis poenicansa]
MPPCSPDRIAAFAAFFRAHYTFVHQNLRRLGVPAAAVEDAAQEVFLVVLRRADAPITNVQGWLFGIVRRIAWRFRRGASRRERLVQALTHQPAPRAADDDAQLLEREAAELLERFLARLDDDKRAVFVLAELEQQTAGEIASALGIKENTVYSRLRAARQEFDRSCARLRLRDQRAVEREALLGRARRAHEPSPAARERVLAGLLVPGIWAMSGGTAVAASAGVPGGGLMAMISGVVGAQLPATIGAVLLAVLGAGAALLEAGRARADAGAQVGVDGEEQASAGRSKARKRGAAAVLASAEAREDEAAVADAGADEQGEALAGEQQGGADGVVAGAEARQGGAEDVLARPQGGEVAVLAAWSRGGRERQGGAEDVLGDRSGGAGRPQSESEDVLGDRSGGAGGPNGEREDVPGDRSGGAGGPQGERENVSGDRSGSAGGPKGESEDVLGDRWGGAALRGGAAGRGAGSPSGGEEDVREDRLRAGAAGAQGRAEEARWSRGGTSPAGLQGEDVRPDGSLAAPGRSAVAVGADESATGPGGGERAAARSAEAGVNKGARLVADVRKDRSPAGVTADSTGGGEGVTSRRGPKGRASRGEPDGTSPGEASERAPLGRGGVLDRSQADGATPPGQLAGAAPSSSTTPTGPADGTTPPAQPAAAALSSPTTQASADGLAREAGLIGEARRAIRRRAWDRAIALLATHAQEFPEGTLRDERWLSQIVATCASGQMAAARAEIERLTPERPALARKAASLCPGENSPGPAAED